MELWNVRWLSTKSGGLNNLNGDGNENVDKNELAFFP